VVHHITIQHHESHFAAASMTRATSLGCDRNGTWLALISVVVAPAQTALQFDHSGPAKV
jgi:hypothetical protein